MNATTNARITQTIRKHPTKLKGWDVLTYLDGQLRRETWTAGNRRRDAESVARDDRQAVEAEAQ